MRAWTAIFALGVIALVTAAALLALGLHHTIAIGGLGLGAVLAVIGAGGGLLRRKGRSIGDKGTIALKGPWAVYRKAIIAVLVVVLIGVGTFYGTSYLAGIQGGASQSGITTTGSGQGSQSTSAVSLNSSATVSIYYANTTSLSTNTTSPSTSTGSTSTVTGTSSVASTGTSTATVSSGTSSTETSTISSTSSTSEPFVLLGSASVTVQGQQATLNAQYTNTGASTVQANVYVEVLSSGSVVGSAYLLSPAPIVSAGGSFNASAVLGSFASGSYTLTFYVVENASGAQLSSSTAIAFDT
jgi:uncharacterized Zn-binding protein involved in type VI secretion